MLEWDFDYGLLSQIKKGDRPQVAILLRDFMDDIADFAETAFDFEVPEGEGPTGGRTRAHISKGNVEKTIYGYRTSIGIDPITELKAGEDPNYPRYVVEGTGHYNPFGPRDIFPAHGNVMSFTIWESGGFFPPGTQVDLRKTKGQPGQDWYDRVVKEVDNYVRVKKRELAVEIGRVIGK